MSVCRASMTTLIIDTPPGEFWFHDHMIVLDHLREAMDLEKKTGFTTRVALKGFDKHGLPIYYKIPDMENQ